MASRDAYSFIHLLEYLLVRTLFLPVWLIPRAICTPLARWVGRLAFYLLRPYRRLALSNVRRALGEELSEAEQYEAARGSFEQMAMNVVDIVHFSRIAGAKDLERIIETDGWDNLREASAQGRGILFISGHLGNWELCAIMAGRHGIPFTGVAQPLPNGYVDDYLTAQRESCGQRIVRKRGALREMLKELKNGSTLGFLVDQNARSHGLLVKFFGHPCSTIPTPASLAMKLKVSVVPAACYRVGNRARFRLVILPPLEMADTGDRQADLVTNTQAMTDVIEQLIRRDPKQWMWLHDRWRLKDSWFHKGRRLASQASTDLKNGLRSPGL